MKHGKLVYRIVVLAALMMGCAMAAPFPPPGEGPVPFRRDRLPLDTEEISRLARAMCEIADATEAQTGVERRAVAQMLAVSTALDPSDARAQTLLRELPERDFRSRGDRVEVEKRRALVWQVVEWLETPDAGIDGQSLAACLKDVMVVADPKNPRCDALRSTGEQAAWSGWVPVLAEYESRPDQSDGEIEEENREGNAEESRSDGPPRIRLAEASLTALIWINEGKADAPTWSLKPQVLTMKAEIRPRTDWETEQEETEQEIHRKPISIGSHSESELLHVVERRVWRLLRGKLGSLPKDMVIEIRHPDLDQAVASGRSHVLSGVCGALAYAAMSGIEPAGLIIGVLEEDGKFVMSTDFWGQFGPLSEMTGLRLIVPAESEEVLMAFLGMEKPEFFLNNEVLLAKDLDEVMRLAAKSPQAPLDGVLGRFKEIQERKGGQDVRIYIGNTFMRQRLEGIQQEEPRHLSAKALVIQALGKRPTSIPRFVLASELQKSVFKAGWIRSTEYVAPRTSMPLGAAFEACKAEIDQVSRFAKKDDQDLVDKARQVAYALRDLDSATRRRGEFLDVERNILSKKRTMDRAYDDFMRMTNDILKR